MKLKKPKIRNLNKRKEIVYENPEVLGFATEFEHIAPYDLELILESLQDKQFLSTKGINFRELFWQVFVKK